MCDMASATYALMAAGTAAKYEGAKKSEAAMNEVQTLEADRQKKLRQEADAALNAGIQKSGVIDVNTDIENNKAQRILNLENSVNQQGGTQGNQGIGDSLKDLGVSSNNRLVKSEVSSNKSQNAAQANSTARAMASMGGFGDTMMNTGIRNARGLQDQARLGNFMQGSAGVADIENQQASHRGDNMRLLGDVLNTMAIVSGGYAANGTNPLMTSAEKADAIAKAQTVAQASAASKAAETGFLAKVGQYLPTNGEFAGAFSKATPMFTPYLTPPLIKRPAKQVQYTY